VLMCSPADCCVLAASYASRGYARTPVRQSVPSLRIVAAPMGQPSGRQAAWSWVAGPHAMCPKPSQATFGQAVQAVRCCELGHSGDFEPNGSKGF
jgi:hypothetical protein